MVIAPNKHKNGSTPTAGEIAVKNPVTGEVIGTVTNHTAETVEKAVQRVRKAQRIWAARPIANRAEIVQRFADLLWERRPEAYRIVRSETGKTEAGAYIEVLGIDNTAFWLSQNAESVLSPQRRKPFIPVTQYAKVHYKPHGVVGFITPWNLPLYLAFVDVLPALVAGNTVVIKPSELAPYSSLFLAELMYEAGLPRDVLQIITGDGATGAAVVDNVDMICFTGSTATGRKIAIRAGERLIPYLLELGGNDPSIILKDADIDLAATGVLAGGLDSAGQMCISVERIYVEAPIYDEFVERLAYHANQLSIGAGDGLDVHIGSLTNQAQFDRTEAHVKDALEKGARLVYGGKPRPDVGPLFYEPAILVDCNHEMEIMRDETFGPTLAVMKVKDAEEALKMANDSQYGLSSSIFTRDLKKGEQLALRLDTGDTVVNRTGIYTAGAASLPWGGQKDSGIGRRGGREGLLNFVVTKSIYVDRRLENMPSITLADPLSLFTIEFLRKVRKFIPFI